MDWYKDKLETKITDVVIKDDFDTQYKWYMMNMLDMEMKSMTNPPAYFETPYPASPEPYYKQYPITTTAGCEASAPCVSSSPNPPKRKKLFGGPKVSPVETDSKEEGNNPMNTNLTIDVNAATATTSETQKQRDYLLASLQTMVGRWSDPKLDELRKLYKLDAPTRPQTAADLIAAIKGGKFTVDQKKIDMKLAQQAYWSYDEGEEFTAEAQAKALSDYGAFFALTFTDYPEPDQKAYNAAVTAWEKAKKDKPKYSFP